MFSRGIFCFVTFAFWWYIWKCEIYNLLLIKQELFSYDIYSLYIHFFYIINIIGIIMYVLCGLRGNTWQSEQNTIYEVLEYKLIKLFWNLSFSMFHHFIGQWYTYSFNMGFLNIRSFSSEQFQLVLLYSCFLKIIRQLPTILPIVNSDVCVYVCV